MMIFTDAREAACRRAGSHGAEFFLPGVVWEAITSDNNQLFRGWDRLGSIEVFGNVLDTYDANTLTWTSANSGWVAGWNDSSKCIYIAQSV